jgi:hypothetical protein
VCVCVHTAGKFELAETTQLPVSLRPLVAQYINTVEDSEGYEQVQEVCCGGCAYSAELCKLGCYGCALCLCGCKPWRPKRGTELAAVRGQLCSCCTESEAKDAEDKFDRKPCTCGSCLMVAFTFIWVLFMAVRFSFIVWATSVCIYACRPRVLGWRCMCPWGVVIRNVAWLPPFWGLVMFLSHFVFGIELAQLMAYLPQGMEPYATFWLTTWKGCLVDFLFLNFVSGCAWHHYGVSVIPIIKRLDTLQRVRYRV